MLTQKSGREVACLMLLRQQLPQHSYIQMIQFSVQILQSSVPFNKSYFSRKGSEDAKKINTPLRTEYPLFLDSSTRRHDLFQEKAHLA